MLAAWKKEDPPAHRVKPVPVLVIRHIATVAAHLPPGNEKLRAASEMIITAFFFLLRPGGVHGFRVRRNVIHTWGRQTVRGNDTVENQ